MTDEFSSYRSNLEGFLTAISGSLVSQIFLDIETNPTFDKETLPFKFEYCNSIYFFTDKGNYQLITSQTSEGYDTFWILPFLEKSDLVNCIKINSVVKKAWIKERIKNVAFNISLEFENLKVFIYSAEIYDEFALPYYLSKTNDEMLFYFDDEEEANKFEHSAN